ncbi:ABC transporter permease [Rhodococcus coprophilus]|uniref:ABC transporter permease n=1 Tax=Rhodococcus coprophilus TaxID=38310 RepID=A0A2X4UA60_9NOCA|nr:ABC transporter permease [Rhodococcus coprophilus]MBM7459344.1 NitT/TauT family transport system permease protein [Rhodococcus coprophilus]SQI35831.1 ABC transporter permease [Rhodococcus coprophilus]
MSTLLESPRPPLLVPEAGSTAGRPRELLRHKVLSAVPAIVTLILAVSAWYAVSYLVFPPERRFLLPPPHRIVQVSLLDFEHLGPMLRALWLTAQVSMVGLLVACVLGIGSAILMSRTKWLESALYPYAIILQTVPILAIVPLIGLWFGYGFFSRTVVCVIIALFPMISNTLFGLTSTEKSMHDLFTMNSASSWHRLVKLQLPGALPSIFAGLRISSGLAVIGAVVGDMFFTQGQAGIGTLLTTYRARLQTEDLYAAIGLSSLYGITVFLVVTALTKAAIGSWHSSVRSNTAD